MRLNEFDEEIMFEYVNKDILSNSFTKKGKSSNGQYDIVGKGSYGKFEVEVFDPSGKYLLPQYPIGSVTFSEKNNSLVADMVFVNEKYRGKEIAKEMYSFAYELGNSVKPSNVQLVDGEKMWKKFRKQKAPFAKETGTEKIKRIGNEVVRKIEKRFEKKWD